MRCTGDAELEICRWVEDKGVSMDWLASRSGCRARRAKSCCWSLAGHVAGGADLGTGCGQYALCQPATGALP